MARSRDELIASCENRLTFARTMIRRWREQEAALQAELDELQSDASLGSTRAAQRLAHGRGIGGGNRVTSRGR